MSRVTRSRSRHRLVGSARVALVALALSMGVTGCATGFLGIGAKPTREQAISDCIEKVPAEAVPYADVFAECMEAHGWVYRPPAGPREIH